MQNIKTTLGTKGFSLPTVIVLSLTILIMCLALLQTASTVRIDVQGRYYTTLAEEAAEAGANFASSCLEKSDHVQTWGVGAFGGDKPNLKPSTDCNGTSAYPSITTVYSDSHIETTFEVGQLDTSLPSGAQISSTGTTKVKNTANGSVVRTYTHVMKKTVTWDPNLTAEISVSGSFRTCAILTGSAYCWGNNDYGQLGNGLYVNSLVPVKVRKDTGLLAGKSITDIFSAQYHNCALADGKVYCWGYNGYGQLGNGNRTNSPVPIEVGGVLSGKTVTSIGGSGNTSCAIAESKIYCWGENTYGTVGVASATTYFTTPQIVATGTGNNLPTTYTATQLSTSGSRSNNMCAIANDQAWCWGQNNRGSVGDNTSTLRNQPTKVYQESGLLLNKKIISISQDGYYSSPTGESYPHVCAVATDTSGANGKVYCWGDNTQGQLGINSSGAGTSSIKPVAVRANSGDQLYNKVVTDVVVGLQHSCVLANADVYCWGYNASGQLGDNTNTRRTVPVAVEKLAGGLLGKTIAQIGGGSNRGCAVANSRTYCWGKNSEGQIGDGFQTDRKIPTESYFLRPQNNQYVY